MKKIFLVFCIVLYVFANTQTNIQNVQQFKNLRNNRADVSQFNKLNVLNLISSLQLFDATFQGNQFLTRSEGLELSKEIKKSMVFSKKPKLFLLYFFSSSMPKKSILDFLISVGIIQSNHLPIYTKQYLMGVPSNFKDYMFSMMHVANKYDLPYKKYISDNFALKIDPRFFKMYEIKRVPAIALAECDSLIPTPTSCHIKYMIHGDVSLETFFDRISQFDKKYIPYDKALIANKIYKVKKK